MINNVVLVLGVMHSDSVVHIHVAIYSFPNFFPIRLLQNIEQSSLCDIQQERKLYNPGPKSLYSRVLEVGKKKKNLPSTIVIKNAVFITSVSLELGHEPCSTF